VDDCGEVMMAVEGKAGFDVPRTRKTSSRQ